MSRVVKLCILVVVGIFAVACQPSASDKAQLVYPNAQYVSTDHSISTEPWLEISRRDNYLSEGDIAQVNAWYQTKGWEHIATWRDRYMTTIGQIEIGDISINISWVVSVILDTHPTKIEVTTYWVIFR